MSSLNQGQKHDDGKLRYDLIPPGTERALAEILTFGTQKYADDSWQRVPNAKRRYYAALRRHLDAWLEGARNDTESGYHHLKHALCNVAFLLWLAHNDTEGQI